MTVTEQLEWLADEVSGSSSTEIVSLHLVAGVVAQALRLAAAHVAEADRPARLEVGVEYDLTLRVKATVVEVHDGHGLCYKLQLEPRDYFAGREVCVDADEVVAAKPR